MILNFDTTIIDLYSARLLFAMTASTLEDGQIIELPKLHDEAQTFVLRAQESCEVSTQDNDYCQ